MTRRLHLTTLLLLATLPLAAPLRAQSTAPAEGASATPAAVPLPPDFVRRREARRGWFATREQIARRHPAATLQVFTAAPGVRLVPDGLGGMRVQMTRRASAGRELPATFSTNRGLAASGGPGEEDDKMTAAGTARTSDGALQGGDAGSDECRVQWYRNGARFFPERESHVSRDIPVESVEAVEVYRSANETPVELRGAGADCGVIVIWTSAPAAG